MGLRRFRAPYNTGYIAQETEDAYALADRYVPKYKSSWLKGIAQVASVTEVVIKDALAAYYDANAGATAFEVDKRMVDAWAALKRDLQKITLNLWAETEKTTRMIRKQLDEQDAVLYDELAHKPELTEEAFAYAELQSSALVTGIAEASRESIRGLIAEGVRSGTHPKIIAKQIKDLGIGLAERGPHTYGRVQRYMIGQMQEGVSDKLVKQRTKRFYDKLLRERAESIAQTEMIKTQSYARRAVWKEEAKSGLISPNFRRVWIAGFIRTCEDCAANDGMEAPLEENYPSGDDGPPLHPRCRCTEGLKYSL